MSRKGRTSCEGLLLVCMYMYYNVLLINKTSAMLDGPTMNGVFLIIDAKHECVDMYT